MAKADEVQAEEGDMSLTLQFTRDRVLSPPGKEIKVSEDISYSFRSVIAIVVVRNVPDDLVEDIHKNSSITDVAADSPTRLAQQVIGFVIARINRIISYARNHKGQYWLAEISLDPDNLHAVLSKYNSQVKVGKSDWIRWNPTPNEIVINEGRLVNPAWCIEGSDWEEVKDCVATSREPPLVSHLLAEAEWHAEQGHMRVALTEGVAALEAAMNAFAKTPAAKQALSCRKKKEPSRQKTREPKLCKKLKCLFPVVLSEHSSLTDLLDNCLWAVVMRNKVIHEGERRLDENTAKQSLIAVRRMCEAFGDGKASGAKS